MTELSENEQVVEETEHLLVSPKCMQSKIVELIDNEIEKIAEGKEENLLEKLLEKISSKETYLLDIVPDEALLWMV